MPTTPPTSTSTSPTTPIPSTSTSTPTPTQPQQQQQQPQTLYSIFALTHPPRTPQPKTPPFLPAAGTMTELSFAKTFLSALDSRPLKLQPDYAANPKTLSLNGPYTLPRMAHAFTRAAPSSSSSPSSSSPNDDDDQKKNKKAAVTVLLKSTRNPTLHLTLPDTDPAVTTILALKERVAESLQLKGGTDKVRVLWGRKPVADVKTLKELMSGDGDDGEGMEMEFGVMIMGYNKDKDVGSVGGGGGKKTEEEEGKEKKGGDDDGDDVAMGDADADGKKVVAQGTSGEEVLADEAFWADLKGFLVQRIRDEGMAGEVFERFREGWGKR